MQFLKDTFLYWNGKGLSWFLHSVSQRQHTHRDRVTYLAHFKSVYLLFAIVLWKVPAAPPVPVCILKYSRVWPCQCQCTQCVPHLVSSCPGVQGGKARSRSGCSSAGSLGLLVNDPILQITSLRVSQGFSRISKLPLRQTGKELVCMKAVFSILRQTAEFLLLFICYLLQLLIGYYMPSIWL